MSLTLFADRKGMPSPNRSIDSARARRLLGVSPETGPEGLRQAFNRAVKAVHPDRHGGDGEGLRQVIEAYRWLDAAAPRPAPAPPPATEAGERRLEITPEQAMVGGWARLASGEGGARSVRLPAGLRAGDLVRMSGETFKIAILRGREASISGDDLLMSVEIGREMRLGGGRLAIETPTGPTTVWISKADAARGFARVCGLGLPARGSRAAGDLLLRLQPAPDARYDTPAQAKRRRFAAAWTGGDLASGRRFG
jgi:curved DNA-binding protein